MNGDNPLDRSAVHRKPTNWSSASLPAQQASHCADWRRQRAETLKPSDYTDERFGLPR